MVKLLGKLSQTIQQVRNAPRLQKAAQNFLNATTTRSGAKVVLIDGTSVAADAHGSMLDVGKLEQCLRTFGGTETYAVVPQFRLKQRFSTNNTQLQNMQKRGLVIITPGKDLNGQVLTCDPNPIIMDIASEFNADVVSNGDFQNELNLNPSVFGPIIKSMIRFKWDPNGNIQFMPK